MKRECCGMLVSCGSAIFDGASELVLVQGGENRSTLMSLM